MGNIDIHPKHGNLYGIQFVWDNAQNVYILRWGNFAKTFYTYDEMETFVLCANVARFQMNILAYHLECGDIVEVAVSGRGSGKAEVVLNNTKRGCLILSWLEDPSQHDSENPDHKGDNIGIAYNNIDEIRIIKKNAEDIVL